MEIFKDGKNKNIIGSSIFVILMGILLLNSRKTKTPILTYILTSGILLYTFSQIYVHFSVNNSMIEEYMFIAQIIFNSIIIMSFFIENSNIENYGPDHDLKKGSDDGTLQDTPTGRCSDTNQFMFNLSPVKHCCGGDYMRTSDPILQEYCKQFSREELINSCIARKNEYIVPVNKEESQPTEQPAAPENICKTCNKKSIKHIDNIGMEGII